MARRKMKLSKSRKERLKQIGKWAGLGLLSYETFMLVVRERQRTRDVFNLALQQQAATKKPLLIVGDPKGSIVNRIFGDDFDCSGDTLCLDPRGCAGCTNVDTRPLPEALSALGSGQYIVFVPPGKLERAAGPTQALLQELQRVSGGDLFVANRNPWTVLSLFARRRIKSAPPATSYTEWRDLPWMPGPSKTERLGALSDTKSLWPLVLGLGAAGAFVGFKLGDDRPLPALAGAAAGTAAGALVFKSRREATAA